MLAEQFPYATTKELIEMMNEKIRQDEEKNKDLEKVLGFSL